MHIQEFPLIGTEELRSLYPEPNLVLVDASAKQKYLESHLEGAIHADLDTQMADIKANAADGGRHPLPTPEQFAQTLGGLGITPDSRVVVYDDKQGGNAAARFWWMLRSIGHSDVRVLDGGFQAAVKAGLPVNSTPVTADKKTHYPVKDWSLPLADINLVDRASQEPGFIIVDVRDENRYKGISEPIDLVAGHIPQALNLPYTQNLDPEGKFLPAQELKARYSKAFENVRPENIIVHCGSGVTACHTLLAVAAAGLEMPRLYVGSWSEWSRTGREIVKE